MGIRTDRYCRVCARNSQIQTFPNAAGSQALNFRERRGALTEVEAQVEPGSQLERLCGHDHGDVASRVGEHDPPPDVRREVVGDHRRRRADGPVDHDRQAAARGTEEQAGRGRDVGAPERAQDGPRVAVPMPDTVHGVP